MKIQQTERGFTVVVSKRYREFPGEHTRLVQESSAIGNYDDAVARPGSSFLWIGYDHHLDREEVAEMIAIMQRWLDTGTLKTTESNA